MKSNHPLSSMGFRYRDFTADWGKEDAVNNVGNNSMDHWGPEACELYLMAYKKQILVNLVTGENDGKNERD